MALVTIVCQPVPTCPTCQGTGEDPTNHPNLSPVTCPTCGGWAQYARCHRAVTDYEQVQPDRTISPPPRTLSR
jgi:DnaJ-class molecular chaperone